MEIFDFLEDIPNIFNFWQTNLILYLILIVLSKQYFKIATHTSRKDGPLTVVVQLISGLSILVLVPFFDIQFPSNTNVWIFLGLAIIFYTISDRLSTTARKKLSVSTETILSQMSSVFMIIIGLLFFKEELIYSKIIGGLIIVFSNAQIFLEKGKFKFKKHVATQLISTLCFSIGLSLDVGISNNFNIPMYISLTLLVPAMLLVLFEKISFKSVTNELKFGNRKAIIIASISWAFALFFGLRAYNLGTAGIIAPLSSLAVILNVVIAHIFLCEKDHYFIKVLAAIQIILAIILITSAKYI